MSVHLHEETNCRAKSVDQALRRCYGLCLGVDPLDPDGHSEGQDDPSFVRDLFSLKVAQGGGGFRPTARRAQFLNTLNTVAPQLIATEHTRGLWASLSSVFGDGSFDDANSATRWTRFHASGSRYAQALASEWRRL